MGLPAKRLALSEEASVMMLQQSQVTLVVRRKLVLVLIRE